MWRKGDELRAECPYLADIGLHRLGTGTLKVQPSHDADNGFVKERLCSGDEFGQHLVTTACDQHNTAAGHVDRERGERKLPLHGQVQQPAAERVARDGADEAAESDQQEIVHGAGCRARRAASHDTAGRANPCGRVPARRASTRGRRLHQRVAHPRRGGIACVLCSNRRMIGGKVLRRTGHLGLRSFLTHRTRKHEPHDEAEEQSDNCEK